MRVLILALMWTMSWCGPANSAAAEPGHSESDGSGYYEKGELAGSLQSDQPLPVYDPDPTHLWNRLESAFYIRHSHIPSTSGGPPIHRIEGGDYIDFFGWGRTEYWSSPQTAQRLIPLLDEYLNGGGERMIHDPLRRAVMLRDLWAAYDFLVGQNIARFGSRQTRKRRDEICRRLARVIASLALSRSEIAALPDTYAAAVASGSFAPEHGRDPSRNYLPYGLLERPSEWVEIDFYQPNLHEDLYDRFITLHTRAYRGRSYFRIFYRFPKGRTELVHYLQLLDKQGVDWRQAAQDGFILLKKDAPQIPVGTEVALVQFMMTLDDELRPTPTRIVESVRHRTYLNTDGSSEPETNTGVGMNVMEYTMKRRLLFDDLRDGGLHREPDGWPQYRVIFQPPDAPDWGTERRKVLFQQCVDCHMTPRADRTGVHSLPSIVHMGGFDAGAQLGIAVPLDANKSETRGKRVARWKSQHETYRRLLEYLGR